MLIFDEVMTGFRVALGGAQARYGIRPDLTTLGKVIGGGLPVGAFGGRRDDHGEDRAARPGLPGGHAVRQSGRRRRGPGDAEARRAARIFSERSKPTHSPLVEGLIAEAQKADVAFSAQSIGSMFGLYFRASPPTSFAEVMQCDKDRFNRFFHAMLERGVYLAPSAYEAGFVSAAHGAAEIEATLAAAREAFAALDSRNSVARPRKMKKPPESVHGGDQHRRADRRVAAEASRAARESRTPISAASSRLSSHRERHHAAQRDVAVQQRRRRGRAALPQTHAVQQRDAELLARAACASSSTGSGPARARARSW